MNGAESSNDRPDDPVVEGGVFAALPRTRPQRASARRAAARGKPPKSTNSAKSETAGAAKKPRKATSVAKPATKAGPGPPPTKAKPRSAAPGARAKRQMDRTPPTPTIAEPAAPKQGYEPEEDLGLGGTVNPPSGIELLESLGDIASELVGSGLTAGGRLLKDAFSILRRP
ncbi:MAG TPA: hypothetical protein VIG42_08980 [Solirubrobacteraceae bacterium]